MKTNWRLHGSGGAEPKTFGASSGKDTSLHRSVDGGRQTEAAGAIVGARSGFDFEADQRVRHTEAAYRAAEGYSACEGVSAQTHGGAERSEEHTSELQSRQYLVCRLLLEKKKK